MNENSYRLKSSLRKIAIRASMFLIYIFIGSAIFMLLEKKSSEEKKKIEDKWLKLQKDLENNIFNKNMTNETSVTDEIKKYTEEIVRNVETGNYRSYRYLEWRFVDSFFFCANVITTIGYGHITPTSDVGRIIMMLYALFGIPLTGFFLRTVGNEVTSLIGYLIKIYERKLFNREAEKLEMKCALIACGLALFMLFIGAMAFMLSESKWSYVDGFYFCFVTLTTIGFGDYVPNQDKEVTEVYLLLIELASLVYYVLGLSIMSTVIVSISGVIEEKTRKLDVTDPMDAIRNLRIENLNSKAMKKLGYKVEEGFSLSNGNVALPASNMNPVNDRRRGTIIPDDSFPPIHKKSLTPQLPTLLKQNSFVNKGYEANENMKEESGAETNKVNQFDPPDENIPSSNEGTTNNNMAALHFPGHRPDTNNELRTPKTSVNSINVSPKTSVDSSTKRNTADNNTVNGYYVNNNRNNNNNINVKNKSIKKKTLNNNYTDSEKLHGNNNNNNNNKLLYRNQNSNLKRKIMSKETRKISGSLKHVGLPSELFASSYNADSDEKYIVRRSSSCEIDMKNYGNVNNKNDHFCTIKSPLAFSRSVSLDSGSYNGRSDKFYNYADDSST